MIFSAFLIKYLWAIFSRFSQSFFCDKLLRLHRRVWLGGAGAYSYYIDISIYDDKAKTYKIIESSFPWSESKDFGPVGAVDLFNVALLNQFLDNLLVYFLEIVGQSSPKHALHSVLLKVFLHSNPNFLLFVIQLLVEEHRSVVLQIINNSVIVTMVGILRFSAVKLSWRWLFV